MPFTIHNTAERDEHGHELVRWNRTFYFHNKKRYFNAVMKLDANEIVDYFGEPHLLVSTLNFHIDELGGNAYFFKETMVLHVWKKSSTT